MTTPTYMHFLTSPRTLTPKKYTCTERNTHQWRVVALRVSKAESMANPYL